MSIGNGRAARLSRALRYRGGGRHSVGAADAVRARAKTPSSPRRRPDATPVPRAGAGAVQPARYAPATCAPAIGEPDTCRPAIRHTNRYAHCSGGGAGPTRRPNARANAARANAARAADAAHQPDCGGSALVRSATGVSCAGTGSDTRVRIGDTPGTAARDDFRAARCPGCPARLVALGSGGCRRVAHRRGIGHQSPPSYGIRHERHRGSRGGCATAAAVTAATSTTSARASPAARPDPQFLTSQPATTGQLEIVFNPRRAGTNLLSAAVDYEIGLRNTGQGAARGITVDIQMMSAGAQAARAYRRAARRRDRARRTRAVRSGTRPAYRADRHGDACRAMD